jgi:CTP synthase
MRLGAYDAKLAGSKIGGCVWRDEISERHRHRYEVNMRYRAAGELRAHRFPERLRTVFCRKRSKFEDHPWFIGVQYHPELKSRPFEPHPLFASFIEAALEQSRLV